MALTQVVSAMTNFTAPTIQRFTSGSGTYTPPTGCKYIIVEMVGGGASGTGNSGVAGTAGNPSTFYNITCAGGDASGGGGASPSGAFGGAVSLSAGTTVTIASVKGGDSASGAQNTRDLAGIGGSSFFGGAGLGGTNGAIGRDAAANSGSGGGGSCVGGAGAGGAAGGYFKGLIASPTTYSYSVGASATAPTGGGNGASGVIIVTEYYQ